MERIGYRDGKFYCPNCGCQVMVPRRKCITCEMGFENFDKAKALSSNKRERLFIMADLDYAHHSNGRTVKLKKESGKFYCGECKRNIKYPAPKCPGCAKDIDGYDLYEKVHDMVDGMHNKTAGLEIMAGALDIEGIRPTDFYHTSITVQGLMLSIKDEAKLITRSTYLTMRDVYKKALLAILPEPRATAHDPYKVGGIHYRGFEILAEPTPGTYEAQFSGSEKRFIFSKTDSTPTAATLAPGAKITPVVEISEEVQPGVFKCRMEGAAPGDVFLYRPVTNE